MWHKLFGMAELANHLRMWSEFKSFFSMPGEIDWASALRGGRFSSRCATENGSSLYKLVSKSPQNLSSPFSNLLLPNPKLTLGTKASNSNRINSLNRCSSYFLINLSFAFGWFHRVSLLRRYSGLKSPRMQDHLKLKLESSLVYKLRNKFGRGFLMKESFWQKHSFERGKLISKCHSSLSRKSAFAILNRMKLIN